MAVNNSLAKKKEQKMSLSNYLKRDVIKDKINEVVGGKNGQRFISSIVSATTNNPTLQECDNGSILSAALLGESLNLSPSPQLGHYYMVPFEDKKKGDVAQFIMGYKGYVQLAIRSGQYKKMTVEAVKKGELIAYNPFNEDFRAKFIEDPEERENAETVGYYAMFETVNGFNKMMYWSKSKMEAHAKKYSKGYAADIRKGTKYTFWSKDFDGMAYKTMLRQLISKWGIMSIDLQNAIEGDMAVINEDGSKSYVETEAEYIETEDFKVDEDGVVREEVTEENASTNILFGGK